MATVCLAMIVKNEAKVIRRCLKSVKPWIDYWIIVDTGSVDGTQDLVCKTMEGTPGELHEKPWKDFATNRNESLELARGKADYVLVMDADDWLEVDEGGFGTLVADSYQVLVELAGTSYWRTHVFKADKRYRYTGVLHEVLMCDGPQVISKLEGVKYKCSYDSSRSADPMKFHKDAAILKKAFEAEPEGGENKFRYAFYLAQSWRDAEESNKALAAYRKRAEMGGWVEEVWYSLFEIAKITDHLGRGDKEVIAAYLKAYEYRPRRAESMCYLAKSLRERGRIQAAYPFAKVAAETKRPDDTLFLDDSVYEWRSLDEFAVAAYWVEDYDAALVANMKLLVDKKFPEREAERIQKNLDFCKSKLKV